jgi:hypothetical protein
MPLPFQRYLREESPWSWPAWIAFCCTLIFCTIQAIPTWTHPSMRLGIPLGTCFWILGISGAATGWVVARYRLAGLCAGPLAGCGSLLATVYVFQGFTDLPRIAVVFVQLIGLLPGAALYWIIHVILDRQGLFPRQKGIESRQANAERE